MGSADVQQRFFQHIKDKLPAHLSLVDEVAALLNISNDSAYRRIRAEKPISFEELQLLCSQYKISLDQFLHLQSDAIIFNGRVDTAGDTIFEDYLKNVLQQFQKMNSFASKHMYVLMKDIPPFVHFQIPELAKFKFYFWMKSILHDERLKKIQFSLDDPRYEEFIPLSKKVIEAYNTIPVTEIWNIESINSSLRQIDFYRQSGMYKNKNEIKLLYEKLEELINHIERQAELGIKFLIGTTPGHTPATYNMFVNELILGDNTYLAQLGDTKLTFLNHSVLYFVATTDEQFNTAMFRNLINLTKKSTQLSSIGEKERVRFFNRLRDKIHYMQASLT